jgi:hypothetical protein
LARRHGCPEVCTHGIVVCHHRWGMGVLLDYWEQVGHVEPANLWNTPRTPRGRHSSSRDKAQRHRARVHRARRASPLLAPCRSTRNGAPIQPAPVTVGGYLRLLAGPVSGQTRSRCSARRSHSAAAHRCHWCGSHMACGLAGCRARRGSKGVCSARSSGALLAQAWPTQAGRFAWA